MGQRYLIDSNVIIDYSGGLFPTNASDFVEQICNTDFRSSIVVNIEVLGYDYPPDKLLAMEDCLHSATVIQLYDEVIQQTIHLRRKYRKIKLGDSIIAATAITNNLVLVTRNVADFDKVVGLQLINPWDIL